MFNVSEEIFIGRMKGVKLHILLLGTRKVFKKDKL